MSSEANPLRVIVDSGNKITDQKLNIFSSDASTLVLNDDNSRHLTKWQNRFKISSH